MSALPDLPIRTLDDDAVDTTLMGIADGRKLIIDFWTTRCERCPDALTKLDGLAEAHGKPEEVLFLSICLDDEEFAKELVEEGGWENMTHAFMELETKEKAKEVFGFSSVPFLVVAQNGLIVDKGSPKKITVDLLKEFMEQPLKKTTSELTTAGASADIPIDMSMNKLTLEESAPPATPEFTIDEDF